MSRQKNRPYKILIIDDDKNYVESIFGEARKLGLHLQHVTNLEEAKEIVESAEGKAICGVILDIICMIKKNEIPDADFIGQAIHYFQQKNSQYQIVILTGEPDKYKNLKELFHKVYPIYSKGRDEETMFKYLKDKASKLSREKTIRKYDDVFEIVRDYVGYEAEEALLACLNNMGNSERSAITGVVSNIRKLQEMLYFSLNRIDNKMVPDELVYHEKTKIDNKKIIRNLTGNFDRNERKCLSYEYIKHNSKADRLLNFIYKGCSEEIHYTDQNTTRYTVQSLVYGFMDLVLWLGEIAKAKK